MGPVNSLFTTATFKLLQPSLPLKSSSRTWLSNSWRVDGHQLLHKLSSHRLFSQNLTFLENMAAFMKVAAVAIVAAIICSASLLGQTDAKITFRNHARTTNVSVHDITMGLILKDLGPNEVGSFTELSPLNEDLFKILDLITNEIISKQFFRNNTTVVVLDDGFGDVSVLVESESSSA